MNFIRTYTGREYRYEGEDNNFSMEDISHSLSLQCRYSGHTRMFYSVAEHSVLLANYAMRTYEDMDLAWDCLMHDSTEAYVCDMPRPLKPLLKNYNEIEDKVGKELASKFNFSYPLPPKVKELDYAICVDEMNQLMKGGFASGSSEEFPAGLDVVIQGWHWEHAKAMFQSAFIQYNPQYNLWNISKDV